MEKLKSQVNVTFWFSGQSDILVLADVLPPPEIEIGLNMNAIEREVIKYFYNQSPPFQYHYLILCLDRKLVNFNFKWIWIHGLEPHLPPLSSQKNEMLVFGLHSTSDDQPGWLMDSNPICHPSPAKKMKCSFLDYIQLLKIGWDGQWTRTPSATSLQPKKMKCSFLDYIQLLIIRWAGRWTRTPSTTSLHPKK